MGFDRWLFGVIHLLLKHFKLLSKDGFPVGEYQIAIRKPSG